MFFDRRVQERVIPDAALVSSNPLVELRPEEERPRGRPCTAARDQLVQVVEGRPDSVVAEWPRTKASSPQPTLVLGKGPKALADCMGPEAADGAP